MNKKVFPTKSNLINTKKSLELTKTGWEFLDKKRSILVREMMMTIDKAREIQSQMNRVYSEAYDAVREASVSQGLFGGYSLSVPVDNSIEIEYRSVMGIEIPKITMSQGEIKPYYGMEDTCSQLDEAYLKFNELKGLICSLAEVESSVYRLAEAVKKTQKRANALKNIVIPGYEKTVKYISEALDENERESFSRLKVVKAKTDE